MTLLPRMACFAVPKSGNSPAEWEDGAAMDPGDLSSGRPARVAIADGASAAYGARRWAAGLTSGFTSPMAAPTTLDRTVLTGWFGQRQAAWAQSAAEPVTVMEQLKAAEGSFATFLGCVLTGLGGPEASWQAAALGDSVLFHVRGTAVAAQLPPLGPGDFGRHPTGAHTDPQALPQMADDLLCARGQLQPGDHLFLVTDALAEWVVGHDNQRPAWQFLTQVSHPDLFTRFVGAERATGAMTNDDVTLVRVFLADTPPNHVLVCR